MDKRTRAALEYVRRQNLKERSRRERLTLQELVAADPKLREVFGTVPNAVLAKAAGFSQRTVQTTGQRMGLRRYVRLERTLASDPPPRKTRWAPAPPPAPVATSDRAYRITYVDGVEEITVRPNLVGAVEVAKRRRPRVGVRRILFLGSTLVAAFAVVWSIS